MLAGMSEYYGSEGFDRPPSDVYSYGGGYFGYNVGCVFVCVCVCSLEWVSRV